MSVWGLQASGSSDLKTQVRLRDRAMLLLSTTLGFRGNSSRMVQLSDLFFRDVPMINIGEDVKLQVRPHLSLNSDYSLIFLS
jgi:hypothetical protein